MARPEQLRNVELDPALVEAFTATFIPRRDQYPQQLLDGGWMTVHQPLAMSLVEAHLKRQRTIGAYALNSASMAKWVCLDADTEQQWNDLLTVYDALAQAHVTPYLERSRRGGHLWLFTPLLPGVFARRFARQLLVDYQVGEMEIYPKQDQLVSGSGSLVRLPFGVHRVTGQVYSFVTPNGQPLAPTVRAQLALLSSPERVPLPFYLSVLSRVQAPDRPTSVVTTAFRRVENTTNIPLSERVKDTISVLEFVSRYVQLDYKRMGYCPFHDDQHKSFAVNEEYNYWHCFAGCGGGSIIDFWMKWRQQQGQDSSFTATIKDLRTLLL